MNVLENLPKTYDFLRFFDLFGIFRARRKNQGVKVSVLAQHCTYLYVKGIERALREVRILLLNNMIMILDIVQVASSSRRKLATVWRKSGHVHVQLMSRTE